MDFTPWIGPAVTLVVTVVGFFVINYAAFSARFARLETKIDNLEKQFDNYRDLVERTAALEISMKSAFHKIVELHDYYEKIDVKLDKIIGKVGTTND